jgi:hypothetical protein
VERGKTINIGPKDSQFPVEQLSVRAGENISWSNAADKLYWTLGPELYHADLDGIFDIQKDESKSFKVESGENIGFKQKNGRTKRQNSLSRRAHYYHEGR